MKSKEIKIYALLVDNISRQLLFILDRAKKRKIKITNISISHYIHQQIVEDMNITIILGDSVQEVYKLMLNDSISVSVNSLFVFNIIELKGEKESGFQIRV